MNNKLVCPFCEYELQENRTTNLCCPICGLVAPTKLWQALIQSQQDLEESQQATLENAQTILEIHKDLEIARKALEEIDGTRCIPQQTLISLGKFSKTTRFNAGNIICVATPDYIHNTLEQIEHKE